MNVFKFRGKNLCLIKPNCETHKNGPKRFHEKEPRMSFTCESPIFEEFLFQLVYLYLTNENFASVIETYINYII